MNFTVDFSDKVFAADVEHLSCDVIEVTLKRMSVMTSHLNQSFCLRVFEQLSGQGLNEDISLICHNREQKCFGFFIVDHKIVVCP